MKNFFRSTLKWFRTSESSVQLDSAPIAPRASTPVETAEPIEVTVNTTALGETPSSSPSENEMISIDLVETPPEPLPEPLILKLPEPSHAFDHSPAPAPQPVSAPVEEPGLPVTVFIRGNRHYANCPHCEASWSLRDRLFDPRTGRALAPHAFPCPSCRKSVAVPGDMNLRSIR